MKKQELLKGVDMRLIIIVFAAQVMNRLGWGDFVGDAEVTAFFFFGFILACIQDVAEILYRVATIPSAIKDLRAKK